MEKHGDDNKVRLLKRKGRVKNSHWALKATIITFFTSAFFSFVAESTESNGNLIVIVVLLSGACTVVITASVTKGLDTVTGKLVAVAVSAIISAIIVGGKAALKNLSITKSTELVIMFSKVLSELLPEKRKKKRKENPRKK